MKLEAGFGNGGENERKRNLIFVIFQTKML
jgi:hypothetical protein